MNGMYRAGRDAFLSAPSLFDEVDGVTFYREVLRPCRHSRWRRLRDRLRHRYHPSEHFVTESYIHAKLVGDTEAKDGETLTVSVKADGTFTLT